MRKYIYKILSPLSLLLFIAFNFQDNTSGWYQQFLPSIGNGNIVDITFTDSLSGYIVTDAGFGNNNYLLKTTNGGDNWNIVLTDTEPFVKVKFINQNTRFTNAFQKIYKTTNAGLNWNIITLPGDVFGDDMFVLNQDTIWLANSGSLVGGVFRTTNGGVNWTQQLNIGSLNPVRIYFYNKDIGFISNSTGTYLRKTTNCGVNWTQIGIQGFTDIHFINDLTGWRAYASSTKKTTDGGLSWIDQPLPQQISGSRNILSFSFLNKDTIWGVGGYVIYPNSQSRGVVYTSTNGGTNWFYQVPDTSIYAGTYRKIIFIDNKKGWAAGTALIHTKVGGDPLTSINQTNLQLPSQYNLGQNYPNPFNPTTQINYEIKSASFISIKVFDLQGKKLATLVNQRQNVGSYSVSFDALKYNISSGIYFYSMYLEGKIAYTKKMIFLA
ncbi:MAG: T9SS type A sorting domain-containing protein [Ignavibacteria bacterium]|nr:T9SS type A sorting domain-containing protein [Ignavibacteria bacterium]